MTSAHIYRDALHIDDKRMDSTSLLIPKDGSVPWLEAPAFVREPSVGVDDAGLASVLSALAFDA